MLCSVKIVWEPGLPMPVENLAHKKIFYHLLTSRKVGHGQSIYETCGSGSTLVCYCYSATIFLWKLLPLLCYHLVSLQVEE